MWGNPPGPPDPPGSPWSLWAPRPPPPFKKSRARRLRFVGGLTVLVLLIIVGEVVVMQARSRHTSTTSTTTSTIPVGSPPTSPTAAPTERFLLGPVSATSQLVSDRGALVFQDDFSDPGSGWTTTPLPSGTTFTYGPAGYAVVAKGDLHHFSFAPYADPVQQLSASVSATESSAADSAGGVGVVCRRGSGSSQLQYEFLLFSDRRWYVERRDGVTGTSVPTVLKQGSSAVAPGSTSVAVAGMCASETDGRTTRLALFVNGLKVADVADVATTFQDLGWRSGIDVASGNSPATIDISQFEERDLAL